MLILNISELHIPVYNIIVLFYTTAHNSYMYLTVFGVREIHGRMHPNYCQITTILLVVDLRSSLAYFMMTHPLPIAGKLPIKTTAKQLATNKHTCTHTHRYGYVRLDGSMSIKKRQKIVDKFNDPTVSTYPFTACVYVCVCVELGGTMFVML